MTATGVAVGVGFGGGPGGLAAPVDPGLVEYFLVHRSHVRDQRLIREGKGRRSNKRYIPIVGIRSALVANNLYQNASQ